MDSGICPLCETDSGLYDWSKDCCLARFVAHAPDRTIRIGWLDRFMKQFGQDRSDAVKRLVEDGWKERKLAALSFGKKSRDN